MSLGTELDNAGTLTVTSRLTVIGVFFVIVCAMIGAYLGTPKGVDGKLDSKKGPW